MGAIESTLCNACCGDRAPASRGQGDDAPVPDPGGDETSRLDPKVAKPQRSKSIKLRQSTSVAENYASDDATSDEQSPSPPPKQTKRRPSVDTGKRRRRTLNDRGRSQSVLIRGTNQKGYAAFASHMKMEAATEARLVQLKLEESLDGRRVFLDSDDLKDLSRLCSHVTDSDCLLLLQTKNVLTRPYCLLELYQAIEHDVPIIGVCIRGANMYDFGDAYNFLTHLDTQLEERNPGASALLKEHGVDMVDAAYKLSNRVPKVISVEFNTHASRNVLDASLDDIIQNINDVAEGWTPPELPDKQTWLNQRGSAPSAPQKAVSQHGMAPSAQLNKVQMVAGSGLLQLSKSPVPGLSQIAFKLQAVSKAVVRVQHLQDDCEMFGALCELLEQTCVEQGLKLKV